MSEAEAIKKLQTPNTVASLQNDLEKLGVGKGSLILVHSSLSSLGWVCGGPVAVVQALMNTVTPAGTIVMPAHSGDYSDPAYWGNPPIPAEWQGLVRNTMPAYDPEITPTRGMGVIAETFRNFPQVLRSSHPAVSFTAWGRYASEITAGHSLNFPLGEGSPLARIYDFDGEVLLLGVGYANNTSFHLAENRAVGIKRVKNGGPVFEAGSRVWREYEDIEMDSDVFPQLGTDFEQHQAVKVGRVGMAESRLFKQRAAVDFAEKWLAARMKT